MNILVINCGSSSLKYQLLDMDAKAVLASGVVERIGEPLGAITQKSPSADGSESKHSMEIKIPNHKTAMQLMTQKLTDNEWGVIGSLAEIDALGHRVVQGGEEFTRPVLVDDQVAESIRAMIPLAPLHNPANLTGIEEALALFPGKPNVAVFDTEFHQTLPSMAYMYPLPMELYTELKVRKYGFHGTSHKYVARKAAEVLGRPKEDLKIITLHLGNGCSMAAVKNGVCVDTTLGLTPLAGLMMGTRCGDIDPAIHAFVAEHKGLSISEIDTILNKESGLKGICGLNDMRDIHEARENGDKKAQLAFDMFVYRVKKTIGAYYAVLGGADAVVFTAGIGENDAKMRAAVCNEMDCLGLRLDEEKNTIRSSEARAVHAEGGRTAILIIPTNEELEIATATLAVANA